MKTIFVTIGFYPWEWHALIRSYNNDPFCLNNLAGNPEYEKIEDELKAELI
ncbi:unnamed protein product, partial [marine sediment metagenome]